MSDSGSAVARVRAEISEVERRMRSLNARFDAIVAGSEFTTDDDEHDPEGSTIAFERAQAVGLLADARRELDDLTAALTRIDNGAYGICTICGAQIAAERLDALPAATRCIECSVRVDR
ncbi:TraR/DksA family transcriptional regulator [Antrihabitans cavernicola]|uniref:Dksa/trar family transcriptional regulator n=1 Tax=Antrihabitans cavernicola TaxID=2495913 RepID=A0A5A7SA48_9NOCA|nr:TraR/DksA C4-type zinc finger protein [Spelaeibacter cavernicola]KAA0021443.1 dksa/trar family transcriptional regulator [Spelaeibacter cavernicola]